MLRLGAIVEHQPPNGGTRNRKTTPGHDAYNGGEFVRSPCLSIRILHGSGIALLLAGLAWLLSQGARPELASAADQRGERWYRLTLDGQQVGYLRTDTGRDSLGRWRFHRDLRFVLDGGTPVRTRETLVFDGSPPFALRLGRQRIERPGQLEGTVIERRDGGYQARRLGREPAAVGAAADSGPPQELDLRFTLADYLGFETWLRESEPEPGATVSASALDFGRRQVVPRQFRVVGRNATGYELENPAPLDSTRIQLDRRMRPVSMTLSGLFELERVPKQQALAPRTTLQAAVHRVPTDRSLEDHTRIQALELEVRGDATASELWPELTRAGRLRRTANAVTTPALNGDELLETAEHPVSHPRIRSLARDAVAGIADPVARVEALTRFVNGYVRYREDGIRRDVIALLDEPAGDCTEYADLLTTLARSLQIPSRTVFGLAYADQRPPAFRFHAWNELLVDGEWLVVDPTWNQVRVDATHIPMPRDVAQALGLLTGSLDLTFLVRNVEYSSL